MSKLVPLLCLLAFQQMGCGEIIHAPPCQDGLDVLHDGSFENAMPVWVSDPGHQYFCPRQVIAPPTGLQSGCLGTTGASVETLTQEVSLPAGTTSIAVSGSICIDTAETDNVQHDVLSLDLLDGENVVASLGKFSDRDGARGCRFKPLQTGPTPLTSPPVTARLRLRATQDGPNMLTTFYIDDLKLTLGCTP